MNKIIFTDLDGTLTLKDTYTKFIFDNLTFKLVFKNSFELLSLFFRYFNGNINNDGAKKITFKAFFSGYNMQKSLADFIDEIPWNSKMLETIDEKRKKGYKVIIVTAAPDVYMEQICKHLKYDGFIATKTFREGNILTGIIDGEVCNHDEKPKRIQKFLGDEKPEHTISYGNSEGDHAMLKFCDESYFVNKSKIKEFIS